jgi:hypothetical protein
VASYASQQQQEVGVALIDDAGTGRPKSIARTRAPAAESFRSRPSSRSQSAKRGGAPPEVTSLDLGNRLKANTGGISKDKDDIATWKNNKKTIQEEVDYFKKAVKAERNATKAIKVKTGQIQQKHQEELKRRKLVAPVAPLLKEQQECSHSMD